MGRGKPHKKSTDSEESRKATRAHHGGRRGGRGRGFRCKSSEDDSEEQAKPHRLLESNWGRYDEPAELENQTAEEYDETKDFDYVIQHAGGASSHFQFKNEKELQDELSTTSQNGASILDLDLEQLGNHVSTLKLVEMLSLSELVGDLEKDICDHFHHLMSEEGVSHSVDVSADGSNISLDDEMFPMWDYEGIERYKDSLLIDHLSTHIQRKGFEKVLSSKEKYKEIVSDENAISFTHADEEGREHSKKGAVVISNDAADSGQTDDNTIDDIRTMDELFSPTTTGHCHQTNLNGVPALEDSNVTTIDTKMTAIDDVLESCNTAEDNTVDFLDELLDDTRQPNFHKTGKMVLASEEGLDLDDLLAVVPSDSSIQKNQNIEREDDLDDFLDSMLE